MSIKINQQLCQGCGNCLSVCPGSLIEKNEAGKAYIKYPKECWGCTSCLKECSAQAIMYYLGPDMGGRGGYLFTESKGKCLDWIIRKPDGETVRISVDKTKANQY